ncbi:MAG: TPM domain-containing protein [Sphingomicrobium sp.]
MKKLLAVLWLALFALATPAWAQTFPKLTGRVVDQAHLLQPAQVQALTAKSEALEQQTGRQFVIATVTSLEGRPIEDYGYRLGRTWGIGQKGKDDGVILLVAPNERKVRIETGYGARVFLTDALSSVIIRESILPRFKAGDYPGGISAGADQVIKTMSLSPADAQRQAAEAARAEQARANAGSGVIPVIFWLMIAAFVLLSMFRRAVGRRYRTRRGGISPWVVLWGLNELSRGSRGGGWGGRSGWGGGGGFGGGGGGFSGGGGSFGGGGASGGW